MEKQTVEDVNLWREVDLVKNKKKPKDESYEEDIHRIHEKMEKGVKFII